MSLFSRKNPYEVNHDGLDRPSKKKPISRDTRNLVIWMLANTVLALVLYFGLLEIGFNAVFWIYIGAIVGLLLTYIIYNQGFVLRGVTPEMLADTYTPEEKQQMIADAKRRTKHSRWMLALIIPLTVAVFADALYMFVLEDLLASLDAWANS